MTNITPEWAAIARKVALFDEVLKTLTDLHAVVVTTEAAFSPANVAARLVIAKSRHFGC